MAPLLSILLSGVLATQIVFKARTDTYACQDKTFMEDFANALLDQDSQAVNIAILAMNIADDCIRIEEGQSVNVTDVGFFDPVHEIRITGRLGHHYVVAGLFEHVR